MNQPSNEEVVRQIYAAFGRGDIPAVLDCFAEDVDWRFFGPAEIPYAGHYHSRAEMARFFAVIGETVEVHEFQPQEWIAGGSHVVVLGRERIRVKATGRFFETHWAHVFTLRGGKVARLREYYDTAAMAAAFRGK